MIPKDGGNQFSGTAFFGGSHRDWQSSVWNPRLGELGVASREQVQVPFLFEHNKVWLDLYAGWWEYGFKKFKERAGEDQVLTFVVELGPPTYAIQDAEGKELSDRWEEAIYLKDLVREIWDRC